jgi:hypothetical protein
LKSRLVRKGGVCLVCEHWVGSSQKRGAGNSSPGKINKLKYSSHILVDEFLELAEIAAEAFR